MYPIPVKPLRAGIYARISQDRSGEALGVERQMEDCTSLAEGRGWQIVGRYVDNDISASTKSKKARPEYVRLRQDVEAGALDGLVVYSMDRLTRRMSELVEFIDWRERVGVPFMTTEGDDTETANGRMVIQIKGAVAQQESERISERVTRARRQARAAGKATGGGTRPFGWTDHRRTKVVDREAEAIRQGYRTIMSGGTRGDWMRWMIGRDITPVKGGQWQYNTVKNILLSPSIAGLVPQGDGTYVPARDWKAVLTAKEFGSLSAAMGGTGQQVAPVRGGVARAHIYAGLVFCGSCGSRMVAQVAPSRSRWGCVAHTAGGCNKVFRNFERVNGVVDAVVTEALSRMPEIAETPGKGDDLSTRILQVESDIADARVRWRDGELAREDFYAVTAELRAEVNELKGKQVSAAQMAARALEGSALTVWQDVRPETFHLRRAIATGLIERVVIHPVGKGTRGVAAAGPRGLDILMRQ